MDIVLIGSGNVATQLGKALQNKGHRIRQVYSRKKAHAEELVATLAAAAEIKTTALLAELEHDADLYFICVTDAGIPAVVAQLPADLQGIVVHTSGSTPMNVFGSPIARRGVFYPVQTFSKQKSIAFDSIPIALEASDPDTYRRLEMVARSISSNVFSCDSTQRQAIHVAAVFACNFTNHLYHLAETILQRHQLDLDIIRPLIRETAEKVMHTRPADAQTGPAVRGDLAIVEQHLQFLTDVLPDLPDARELYARISALILNTPTDSPSDD